MPRTPSRRSGAKSPSSIRAIVQDALRKQRQRSRTPSRRSTPSRRTPTRRSTPSRHRTPSPYYYDTPRRHRHSFPEQVYRAKRNLVRHNVINHYIRKQLTQKAPATPTASTAASSTVHHVVSHIPRKRPDLDISTIPGVDIQPKPKVKPSILTSKADE